jgi:ABC-type antimicrobial peptide transport system permease subunit
VEVPASPRAAGIPPRVLSWRRGAGGGLQLVFIPGTGHLLTMAGQPPLPLSGSLTLTAAGPALTPLPAIATDSFLRASHTAVGSVLFETASQVVIPVQIVASVRDFPTVTGSAGGLIVDLAAVQGTLAAGAAAPLPVMQWWLRTAGGAVPRDLPAGTAVTSAGQLAAGLLGNPLSAVPQQAVLAIAVAAALLAALGMAVSVAASVAERRTRSALLAALGVSRARQAGQLSLEHLILSAPAAAVGVLLGAGLAGLLVPAVTVTATAATPVPPVLVQIPLGWAAALAAAVSAVPVLAAAATAARRPDPAAELRAAEAG